MPFLTSRNRAREYHTNHSLEKPLLNRLFEDIVFGSLKAKDQISISSGANRSILIIS